MDRNEALSAIDAVKHTHGRLAQRSQWPLWRHALFALAETVLVFGISLPVLGTLAAFMISLVLTALIVRDDKQRYGVFVSGWQGKRTRIVLFFILLFVCGMALLSYSASDQPVPAPLALVASLGTFIACILGSLWWQKIYRDELLAGGAA